MGNSVDVSNVFNDLKKAILKNKDVAVVGKSDEVITVAFSSLIYSMTKDKEESISFEVLDLNLILNPDNSLVFMERAEDGVDFYELESGPMERKLREHLIWRLEVISDFGF